MIEQKLKEAAARLPEPKTSMPTVQTPIRRRPQYGMIAAILAAVLLVGCVAGGLNISLWYGGKTESWDRADWIAWDHNLQLPETLLDAPFLDCSYYNLTEQRVPYLLAVLFPEYQYYAVTYGTEVTLRDYHRDEDGGGYSQWSERTEVITVTFGSDASEHWRRQFGFDENGIYTGERNADSLIASDTVQMNGMTMYLATYDFGHALPTQRLSWYDYDRCLVVRLEARADSWEPLLEAAEEIHALNP